MSVGGTEVARELVDAIVLLEEERAELSSISVSNSVELGVISDSGVVVGSTSLIVEGCSD